MHTRHTHFRWNHEARLCCFAGGGETPNADVPPAVEASERQDTVPPAAAETPESAADGAAKAAAERGAETLDKQIADTRKQVADLAKLVAILRREIPRQEQMRQEAQKSQAEAPSQASTSEVDEPTTTTTEATATPATADAASPDSSSSPPAGQEAAAPSAADRAKEQLNKNLDNNPTPPAEGSDAPIAASTGEPAVAATEGDLSSALASGEPLTDELFKELQDTLIAREADLETAKANLETLKMQRPEPKDLGEKANRVVADATDIMNDPTKTLAEKGIALLQAAGAFIAIFRESIKGNLNQGADTGAGKKEEGEGGAKNAPAIQPKEIREKIHEQLKTKQAGALLQEKQSALGIPALANTAEGRLQTADTALQTNGNEITVCKQKIADAQAQKAQLNGDAANTAQMAINALQATLTSLETKQSTLQSDKDKATKEVADLKAEIQEMGKMNDELSTTAENVQKVLGSAVEMLSLMDNEFAKNLSGALAGITISPDYDTLGLRVVNRASLAQEIRENVSSLMNGNNGERIPLADMGITIKGADLLVNADATNSFMQKVIDRFNSNVEAKKNDTLNKLLEGKRPDGTESKEEFLFTTEAGRSVFANALQNRNTWVQSPDISYDVIVAKDGRIFLQNADGKNAWPYSIEADKFTGGFKAHIYNAETSTYEPAPLKKDAAGQPLYEVDDVNNVYDRASHTWKPKV